jgi:uncharacterized membrane protein
MSKAVFCLATSEFQAESIVHQLKTEGLSDDAISVLFPDKNKTQDFIYEFSKAADGAATGAGTGSVFGGALGWLAGMGILAIPGAGPFIAAGPILAALGGAAVGATVGGIAGTLVGMGIPEYDAKRYEGKIRAGNILISVHTADKDTAKRIKDTLQYAGAQDISVTAEVTTHRSLHHA